MISSVIKSLNRYSGEIGVAICAISSTLVLGYIMDDCHRVEMVALKKEISILKRNYEEKILEFDTKIKNQQSQMK
jgi:hypothetical protein